jgi:hypothetical protein
MDGERAFEEREPLVFAVDQRPFRSHKTQSEHVNRFCVLHPLMTLEGERLQADEASFPNCGRVWWRLRDDLREELVVPATIWTGTIEEAPRGDIHRFQANSRSIQAGGKDLVELVPVPEEDPDIAWVQRAQPMPWPRPTTAIVMLCGKKTVLGPLRADWLADKQHLHLSVLSPATAEVLRIPRQDFFRLARTEHFTGNLNEFDNFAQGVVPFAVTLSKVSWLHLEELRKVAEELDGSTDAQILNWAARHQNLPRSQLAPLKDLLSSLAHANGPLPDAAVARKLQRLHQLAAEATRVLALEEEVARVLAGAPVFADLVGKHVERLLAQRVEQEIKQRDRQIEAAVQPRRRALDELQTQMEQLAAEYQKKAAAEEEELRRKNAARLRAIEEREKTIAAREISLAEQEKHIVQRLERVIQRYAQEAERVGDDLLAQLPILKQLGLAGGPEAKAAPARETASLTLPAFLERKKTAAGTAPLEEADFLAQLSHVVEQQGFCFAAEDLINFHVCVKTPGLTILAGISGTGKSSLPRLYAEALGCQEEYLHIPVRPDWLDDRDLVGAFNAVAQRFEPANSGLVDRLIAAAIDRQQDRGGIYLICLDEMNLARVEHYFAQFLSKLELPAGQRTLELFASGLVQAADPYHPYQALPLGENVRFVGTVNIDETTHFFSPKVLDRSQVVVFGAPNLAVPRRGDKAGPIHGVKPVPLATYLSWRRQGPGDGPARDFLLRIQEVLQRSRLGLGYRQFDRILDYLASAQPFMSEDQALDFQLLQVVLPRLRPTAPAFPETLQALREVIAADRFPRAADHLGRFDARGEDDFFQLL